MCLSTAELVAHASQRCSFSASLPGGHWELAEEEERWRGEGEIAAFCQSRWSQNTASYQPQIFKSKVYNSNTISVFRLNVSLKTTTEKSLCIKSWVTCLVDHRVALTLKIQSISSSSKKPKRCVSFSKLSTGVGSHSSTVYVGVCELFTLGDTNCCCDYRL